MRCERIRSTTIISITTTITTTTTIASVFNLFSLIRNPTARDPAYLRTAGL
ncbi:hypothetical protein [uncultured Thiodictyon sp.]|uniref:hypothetical protein n=1 Tax=uncultured Thiodictyon sp. TaxID=1846217 RepID=UPI0025E07D04|nr:hypothetical protein [uncultured Thiodictyon sp.]